MNENLLNKVRALLTKANDPAATEAEAISYTDKATELMSKYDIDEALLASAKGDDRAIVTEIINIPGTYKSEQRSLWNQVGHAFSVYTVGSRTDRYSKDVDLVHLFGTQSAIDTTKLLVTSLLVQAATGAARITSATVQTRSYYDSPRSATIRNRKAYLHGFYLAAGSRVIEQHKVVVESTPGVGLVLVSDLKRGKQQAKEKFDNITASRPRSYDLAAKERGFQDGQRADVGARSVGDRSTGVKALAH